MLPGRRFRTRAFKCQEGKRQRKLTPVWQIAPEAGQLERLGQPWCCRPRRVCLPLKPGGFGRVGLSSRDCPPLGRHQASEACSLIVSLR